jgi:peptidyl-prolyl cis-trans isomerase C
MPVAGNTGRASVLATAICTAILLSPARGLGAGDPVRPDPARTGPPADPLRMLPTDPAGLLATMADQLDKKPDFVVLKLESLPITQHDVAGVIRSMPIGMANLDYEEIYRRALDVITRQKAMVLRARLAKLDKDPAVQHQMELAGEHALADVWLKQVADAAVTDKALQERYTSDVAGKPGLTRVRARVILVPSEAEAEGLIQKIRAGVDFAQLAREKSKDPTAANGGDLGYVTQDMVAPEVGAVMFALDLGQMTGFPVRTVAGFFIVRVDGRSLPTTPTFEEARPMLERDLRSDAIRDAIGSLLRNVKYVPPPKLDATEAPGKQ